MTLSWEAAMLKLEHPAETSSQEERKQTGELPLYQGLVRELVERGKGRPGVQELFDEACLALAIAEEAGRLPPGHADRAKAFGHLLTVQRRLMDAVLSCE